MMLFSSHACSFTEPSRTGKVLLILFFLGTFTYFLIGSIVRFMYLGARGVEVIPNLDFWKDLPGLVRVRLWISWLLLHLIHLFHSQDGALFLRNGCRVERSPDPDSYDAIWEHLAAVRAIILINMFRLVLKSSKASDTIIRKLRIQWPVVGILRTLSARIRKISINAKNISAY